MTQYFTLLYPPSFLEIPIVPSFYMVYASFTVILIAGMRACSPESSHKFIIDEKVKVKSIFKGYVDDVVDLPEYKYTINESAFMNLEAYKEII